MAQWGRNDQAVTVTTSTTKETSNGAPIGTYALVKAGGGDTAHQGNTNGTRANTDKNMFNNTTVGAFIPGAAVGVFGVDAVEQGVVGGPLYAGYVSTGGSGYGANATVTITPTNGGTSGVANGFANSTGSAGKITILNISTAGSGYKTNPTIAFSAPAAITLVANTNGAVLATDFLKITSADSKWQVGDRFYYAVAVGNTAIGGMTANQYYYVSFANTTGITIATTVGGANVDITEARTAATAETGHTIQGDTATGYIVVGEAHAAHAGWVLRTEGTGGRAGRVFYETLVAMGSLGATGAAYGTAAVTADASDDTNVPDA